ELICKVFELLVLLLEFSRFEILLDELGEGQVDFQEKFPDYCQGGSMSPDSFLPSILLLVVIIVVVVGVMVVVVIIVAVVVVVESSSVVKLSFAVTFPSILLGNPPMKASMSFSVFGTMFGHKTANSWNLLIPSDLIGLIYSNRLGVCIPPGQGVISQVGLNVSDEDPTNEDGDIGMGDSIGVSVSLGGGISLGGKKSRESNISDSGNTGDGGKTGGGSIGACGGIGGSLAAALYSWDIWIIVKSTTMLPFRCISDFGGVTDWYQSQGDDIEAYNNRFHELALMCPELVPTERKKIEKYVRGFPERIKGNITSSKPALVEQSVQGRATRIGESNKRKWEDHQRNPNNNNYNNNNNRNRNNNYHQQQNRRQETARAYAVVPAEGKVYAGNLPKCNRCNFHHSGQCPPKCQKCQKADKWPSGERFARLDPR
ncbi:hypothetical protein Tco_0464831, partial [Tanacetum coccineum]